MFCMCIHVCYLARCSSLFDNKVLRSFFPNDTTQGPIFDVEFYDHHLIGQGAFFQVTGGMRWDGMLIAKSRKS